MLLLERATELTVLVFRFTELYSRGIILFYYGVIILQLFTTANITTKVPLVILQRTTRGTRTPI